MKSNDLFDAIGNVDDTLILNAKTPNTKKTIFKKTAWISAIAAMLVVSLILVGVMSPGSQTPFSAYALAEAKYPTDVPYPVDYTFSDYDDYRTWRNNQLTRQQAFRDLEVNIDDFLYRSIGEFLSAQDGKNVVFSPLNVYMAFALLAEITDNNSRQQILDVLGCDSIETLRQEASALWTANYSNDGLTTSVLASSVWLSDHLTYKQETLQKLADIYYASSYSGAMGSDEYNQVLQNWLNEQTGGLLKDSVKDIEMDPSTIMALATTIYFKANWTDTFSQKETVDGIFHTPNGDITCSFMKQTMSETCYFGNRFTAVKKTFGDSSQCAMWFILPNEGVSPEQLLSDEEAMTFLASSQKEKNTKSALVHYSVPKFDVSSGLDLKNGMKNLGITDVFDSARSDFSSLVDGSGIAVTAAQHSARVAIDEDGCTATAFTYLVGALGGIPDEIDFTLDRPFLFAITSDVGLPLFVGIVNQPN